MKNNDKNIEKDAEALYEAGDSVRPPWRQLTEETKNVWREFLARKNAGEEDWYSMCPIPKKIPPKSIPQQQPQRAVVRRTRPTPKTPQEK